MADFFEFRTFTMKQSDSGQRINTDSCVFAAVVGEGLASPRRILDIGCGSGIVGMMLCERFPLAMVTAIEIDTEISNIASANASLPNFSGRMTVVNSAIQGFMPLERSAFDFIVCNPPYFRQSTPASDRQRHIARHVEALTPHDLFEATERLLSGDGISWMSCPAFDQEIWIDAAIECGLVNMTQGLLRDHPEAPPHIAVLGFSRSEMKCSRFDISYREARNGPLTHWMKKFRDSWYPQRYNIDRS